MSVNFIYFVNILYIISNKQFKPENIVGAVKKNLIPNKFQRKDGINVYWYMYFSQSY